MTTLAAARDPVAWTALFAIGGLWGLTGPLSKLAVSTGHHPAGITFWTTVIAVAVFTAILFLRGVRPKLSPRHILFFLGCGLLGTALPNTVSYEAYRHLPIGVNVMILSLVPMATLMIALPLGAERVDARRLGGIALGVAGVALITLPDTSLPSPEQAVFVALPVIVAVSYAAENVFIDQCKPKGTDTFTVMWGLSVGGLFLISPVAFSFGGVFDLTVMGPAEQAVIGSSLIHVIAYFGFVWLIERAGPVFASQVGYVVTGAGVFLGMAIYGERHSVWVWMALALLMIGLTLVQPRGKRTL